MAMRQILTPSSTQLNSIAYDTDEAELFIEFNSRVWYRYVGVEPEIVTAVLFAPSQGKAFTSLIRNGIYPFNKLETVPDVIV